MLAESSRKEKNTIYCMQVAGSAASKTKPATKDLDCLRTLPIAIVRKSCSISRLLPAQYTQRTEQQ